MMDYVAGAIDDYPATGRNFAAASIASQVFSLC